MSLIDPWGNVPTGRRLDAPGRPKDYVGSVSSLERADPERLALARRKLTEIPEERLHRTGRDVVDTETGETYRVVRATVDLHDPEASGCSAFTVTSDGLLAGLRLKGAEPKPEVKVLGTMGGRVASGREGIR